LARASQPLVSLDREFDQMPAVVDLVRGGHNSRLERNCRRLFAEEATKRAAAIARET